MKYPVRDYVPHATSIILDRLREKICTLLANALCGWWGVQVGKGVRFYGMPIIRRHPTARITIGDNCDIRSAEWSNTIGLNRRSVLSVRRGGLVSIGDNCGLSGTVVSSSKSIVIGDRVLCGGNCTIVDTDRHPLGPVARARNEPAESVSIKIEDDVFLSMNVVVLKGCSIGKGTVVAANSVVTSSLPAGVIAGGVPARVIRALEFEG